MRRKLFLLLIIATSVNSDHYTSKDNNLKPSFEEIPSETDEFITYFYHYLHTLENTDVFLSKDHLVYVDSIFETIVTEDPEKAETIAKLYSNALHLIAQNILRKPYTLTTDYDIAARIRTVGFIDSYYKKALERLSSFSDKFRTKHCNMIIDYEIHRLRLLLHYRNIWSNAPKPKIEGPKYHDHPEEKPVSICDIVREKLSYIKYQFEQDECYFPFLDIFDDIVTECNSTR